MGGLRAAGTLPYGGGDCDQLVASVHVYSSVYIYIYIQGMKKAKVGQWNLGISREDFGGNIRAYWCPQILPSRFPGFIVQPWPVSNLGYLCRAIWLGTGSTPVASCPNLDTWKFKPMQKMAVSLKCQISVSNLHSSAKIQTNPFMFWSGLCLVATKANTYFPSAFKIIKSKNHHGLQKRQLEGLTCFQILCQHIPFIFQPA